MAISPQKLQKLKFDLLNLIQTGKFKKAEKLYPSVKNQKIKDIELWRLFAGVHSQKNNFIEIVHCCNNILKIDKDDFISRYNMAIALQNLNRIDEAISQYEQCIANKPDYTQAYANCAYLSLLSGDIEKSIRYYQKTLESIDNPELRVQYSQALMARSDHEDAIQQLKYVLSKQPSDQKARFFIAQCYYELQNYPESEKYYLDLYQDNKNDIKVINNLGRLYEEMGKPELALEKYREAIKIDDSIATIYLNLGKVYVKTGDVESAEAAFLRSISLEPEHPESYFNIGKLYNETGDVDKAKGYFIKALDLDVDDLMTKPDEFKLAVRYFLSNIENPESFDDDKKAFVADLFDGYADKFDQHLVDGLKYKTPEIINELLTSYISSDSNNTLDLGCGTGLCCQYLKPLSKTVTGVDLSPRMIDKAHHLHCYDTLIVGEITEVVNDYKEHLDLVVAADVFVYIGSLEDIFVACKTKMSSDGYFIFSTELLSEDIEDEYRLYDSGRYKHSTRYLDKLIEDNDFILVENRFCVLRKENGKDVNGCVTVLKKK